MRRWGSPKTPTIVCRGRKPGNRYESERRRRGLADSIPQSCQVSTSAQPRSDPFPERVPAPPTYLFDPHESPKTQQFYNRSLDSVSPRRRAPLVGERDDAGDRPGEGGRFPRDGHDDLIDVLAARGHL